MPPLISLDLAPAADVYDAVDKNLLFEDLKKQILDNERSMRAEGFAKGGWSVVSLPADAHQGGAILRRHLREMKGCLGMCKLIVHSHFRQKRICPVVLIARLNLLANIRINFFKLANIKGLTPVGIQHLDNFFLPMLSKLHGCAMIGSHRKTPYTMVPSKNRRSISSTSLA